MFHGFTTPNENEHEAFSSQDDSHKLVNSSTVKPNGKLESRPTMGSQTQAT
jgi:hypothetical protein